MVPDASPSERMKLPTPSPVRPLLVHLPPPTRGFVVRSWLALTAWSLLVCLVFFLIGPLCAGISSKLGRMSPEAWEVTAWVGAGLAAATVVITTLMYVPRLIAWPRREQMLEITPDSIVVVRIDAWHRVRRELPVAAVKNVSSIQSQVYAFDGKRRFVLLDFLPAREAKRWAATVREALGLA